MMIKSYIVYDDDDLTRSTIKCLSLVGSLAWVAVLMVEGTIITLMLSWGAAIALYLLISMSLVIRLITIMLKSSLWSSFFNIIITINIIIIMIIIRLSTNSWRLTVRYDAIAEENQIQQISAVEVEKIVHFGVSIILIITTILIIIISLSSSSLSLSSSCHKVKSKLVV